MTVVVDAVLTGLIAPFGGQTSAIEKTPVDGARNITRLGIDGDRQADLSVHGGIDKAIHHYPRDHYEFWNGALGPSSLLAGPGVFGENISTTGLIESDVCIGDRYRLGTALVEVSQGRQPCWKQGHRLNDPRVLATMVRTAKCGWYYRVIERGAVRADDTISLQSRPHETWTVQRVIGLLLGGEGKRDLRSVEVLARMDVLALNWRVRARNIMGSAETPLSSAQRNAPTSPAGSPNCIPRCARLAMPKKTKPVGA